MSRASNLGRADNFLAGRAFAHNAPFSGSRPGILMSHLLVVQYGGGRSKQGYAAPAAADPDGICEAQAKLTAGSLNLNGILVVDGQAELGAARNIQIDSSNAGDTTQTVTVTGLDAVGNALTEDIALNGTTNAFGSQCFSVVTDVAVDAALAGNISIGTGPRLGFPISVWDVNEVLLVNEDGALSTPSDISVSGAADRLGSFEPATVPDGSIVYTVLLQVIDNTETAYDANPAV